MPRWLHCSTGSLRFQLPRSPRNPASRLRSFAAIRFARAFHSCGDRILPAICRVLAALDQVVRTLAKFFRFALRKVPALIGFLREIFARLFSGLRGKQNAHERPDAETYKEIGDLGTNIVRHENLRKNRNIAKRRAQYRLTCIRYSLWLSAGSAPRRSNSFSAVFRGIVSLIFCRPARRTLAMLPNSRRSFCAVRGPMPGMPGRADFVWRAARRWRWKVTAKRCVSSRIC